jgi:thermitase
MKNLFVVLMAATLAILGGGAVFNVQLKPVNTGSVNLASAGGQYRSRIYDDNTAGVGNTGLQWGTEKIMAPGAWKVTSGSSDVLIAVLDTGIDERHEDLSGQVAGRINFTGSPSSIDLYGHGTHIGGIIAAKNNGIGLTGVAYSCRLLNVKVADDGGWCSELSLARGIRWAADHGASVINASLYTFTPSQDLQDAVSYAWNRGAVIVAASGNGVGDRPVYPACLPNCLAVGATDSSDRIAAWSGQGGTVHVAAPGANILSSMPGNSYQLKSGTSMASAYVAGLAGLLFSMKTRASGSVPANSLICSIITKSCDTAEAGPYGRINAAKAIQQMELNN